MEKMLEERVAALKKAVKDGIFYTLNAWFGVFAGGAIIYTINQDFAVNKFIPVFAEATEVVFPAIMLVYIGSKAYIAKLQKDGE